jgi:hypothetical protein
VVAVPSSNNVNDIIKVLISKFRVSTAHPNGVFSDLRRDKLQLNCRVSPKKLDTV